jgi:hypothetical protein
MNYDIAFGNTGPITPVWYISFFEELYPVQLFTVHFLLKNDLHAILHTNHAFQFQANPKSVSRRESYYLQMLH